MDVLQISAKKGVFKLDPRTKFLLLVVVGIIMINGRLTGVDFILRMICVFIPFILLLTAKLFKASFVYVIMLVSIVLCEGYIILITSGTINLVLTIICGIISRFIPGYICGWYVVKTTSVSEFVTSMEKMHIPNFITIPMSVMFRYFPTLKEEYSCINDAMKMREIGHSIKNPFIYVEYILVPIMISTVQIANDLSAASLTKGLGGSKKRTHICNLRLTIIDILIILTLISMITLFFIF